MSTALQEWSECLKNILDPNINTDFKSQQSENCPSEDLPWANVQVNRHNLY